MPRRDELSPWVTLLEEGTLATARALLQAPEQIGLSVRRLGGPDERPLGELCLQVDVPGQPSFELTFRDPDERGGLQDDPVRADVRVLGSSLSHQPGLAPVVDALTRRVAAHASADTELWRAFRDGWQAWRPFTGVPDTHFRWVGRSQHGRRGMLRLGFLCNQDCSFCWQKRDWPEPPPEQFFTWVDEFASMGLDHLFVSGGEPTTWKRLPELIERAAKTHGMRVLLQTNAIALSSTRYRERLLEAGLAVASVSLHAADAAVSDGMTRAPGTFERTVQGIAACRQAGLPVNLTCVVERTNLPGLEDHARMIIDRFVTPFPDRVSLSVAYAHPCASADEDLFAQSLPRLDEVRAPLAQATRLLVDAGVTVTSIGGCGFPACALRDASDLLLALNPADLFHLDQEGRRYGAACSECSMKPHCIGLRAEYIRVHGEAGIEPFAELPALPVLDEAVPVEGALR